MEMVSEGLNAVQPRILIVYATWTGATHEVADFIGNKLRNKGMLVDVERAEKLRDITGYHAVIIGNSVHAGKLAQPALDFVERHRAALCNLPVALFLMCMTMWEDTPESRAKAAAFLQPLRDKAPQMTPVDTALFAGAVLAHGEDFERQNFLMKFMEKRMAHMGDKRDWQVIEAWADKIAPMLTRVPV